METPPEKTSDPAVLRDRTLAQGTSFLSKVCIWGAVFAVIFGVLGWWLGGWILMLVGAGLVVAVALGVALLIGFFTAMSQDGR